MNHYLAKSACLCLALALSQPACHDNSSPTSDLATPPQSDMATVPTSTDMAAGPMLAVATTDFNTGSLSTVGLGSRVVTKSVDDLDAYPVARGFGNMLYVLDQTNGLVRAYNATQNFKDPIEFPASKAILIKGIEANPHDIYIDAPRKLAYVSLYGAPGTAKVNGSHALGVVDLTNLDVGIASFVTLTVATADTDNNPDADQLAACGDKLYVLLLDLDRNKASVATGPGRLAVVNLATPGVPSYIQLAGQHPSSLTILPGCTQAIVGSQADLDGGVQAGLGGIEIVDLVGMKTQGLILKDSDLGGNVGALDAVDAAHVFVNLSTKAGTNFSNTVYSVNLTAKQKGAAVLGPLAFVPSVRVLGGQLVVLSSGTPAAGQRPVGVYVGPATGAALPDAAIDVGMPPQSVTLVTP